MRRWIFLPIILLCVVCVAQAQIGKRVVVQAGTPEDKALQEISATSDPATKLQLLNKYLTDFAGSDAVLAGYEIILAQYQGEKNPAKVFEYADKALGYDADNFNIAFTALRAAQEAGDTAKLLQYGEALSGILSRYKASGAPAGTDGATWAAQKKAALEEEQNNINYAEYALFATGANSKEPAAKAEILERFVNAFPDSPYAFAGATVAADAFRQARQGPKMVTFAEKVLARDPNHYGMLVQLADYWVESQERFDKAIAYASKALEILKTAEAPPNLTPEQWAQQKNLQMGLAYSAIGNAHASSKRYAEAIEPLKAAAPLLKPYDFYYAHCLYLAGFALVQQKKTAEAKPLLTEAASLSTPFKALAEAELSKLGAPAKRPRKRS